MLLLLTVSASWIGAKAQYWEAKSGTQARVDGIYYVLDGLTGTATVTNKTYDGSDNGSNSYSNVNNNAIVIPESFTIDENGEATTYTVIAIDDKAFYGSTEILSVKIPASVTEIGSQAFDRCTKLKEVTVAEQSKYFYASEGVLYNKLQTELYFCPKTKTGTYALPEYVEKIHDFAFYGCKELTAITLPDELTEIGSCAFMGCTGLQSINIPSELKIIGSNAFRNASALSSNIVISGTLSEIASNAFQDCKKLSNITILNGVTTIADNAFSGCTSLKSIELPTSISTLGISAFENTGLTSINIPNSITEIPASAFARCKLTSITLSEGLKAIRNTAFYDNGTTINEVRIPESVTTIDNFAFYGTNVINFYINNTPNRIAIGESSPFQATKISTTIHVFSMMKSIFQNATNWSKYKDFFNDDINITHITSITLDNTKMTVLTGTINKLNATIMPEDARIKDVVFTSSNEDMILITNPATGFFKASENEGSAIITCTAADGSGVYAKCEVTIKNAFVQASSVSISKNEASIDVNDKLQLTAEVLPKNATYREIIWVSSNEEVAKVNNGLITAVGPGVATITAISQDGAARAKCKVTVTYGTYALKDPSVKDQTVEGVTNYTEDEDYFVKEITYTRDFTKTTWQALYVPFAINVEDFENDFEFARLNNVHQYEDAKGKVTSVCEFFKVRSGELKANTPYCIRAKSTGIKTIVVENTTLHKAEINPIDCASTKTKYTFYGTYTGVTGETMVSKKYYAFSNGDLGYTTSTKNSLSAYRWYMDVTSRDNDQVALGKVSFIVIDEDEEATGIENVEASTNDSIIAIYDVNGRKLNALQNGVNIVKYADGTIKKISK